MDVAKQDPTKWTLRVGGSRSTSTCASHRPPFDLRGVLSSLNLCYTASLKRKTTHNWLFDLRNSVFCDPTLYCWLRVLYRDEKAFSRHSKLFMFAQIYVTQLQHLMVPSSWHVWTHHTSSKNPGLGEKIWFYTLIPMAAGEALSIETFFKLLP